MRAGTPGGSYVGNVKTRLQDLYSNVAVHATVDREPVSYTHLTLPTIYSV